LLLLALESTFYSKKNGHFPEGSVGKNKALREKKIYCMKTEQKLIDKQIKAGKDSVCSC
jgi:hypothetical protein